MKNIENFWRFYDSYIASGFSDVGLSTLLSDLVYANILDLPTCRIEKEWHRVLGFVSLLRGKFLFGWVHHSAVLVLDDTKGEYCLVTNSPEVFVHPQDMYGDKASFGMWMPLYTVEQVKAAIGSRPAGVQGPFLRDWCEKCENSNSRVLVPR